MRREVLGLKLSQAAESVQMIENQLIRRLEDNNEHVAILQSLLESGLTSPSVESLPPFVECEGDFKNSEEELETVKTLSDDFTGLEKMFCQITLTDPSNGKKYLVKGTENLSFHSNGSLVGASVSIISYALTQLKAANLWEEVEEEEEAAVSLNNVKAESPILKPKKEHATKKPPLSAGSKAKSDPTTPSWAVNGSSSALTRPTTLPSTPPISAHEHGRCYLQFSVNGEVKPVVVIKLCHAEAPIVIFNFF